MLLYVYRPETVVITQMTFNTHTQVLVMDVGTTLGELCWGVGAARIHALVDGLSLCTCPLRNILLGHAGLV